MDPIHATLAGVALPAVLAGLVLAAGWRVWERDREAPTTWLAGPAIAAAFLAAYFALLGSPVGILPGGSRTPSGLDWLFWVTAAFGVAFAFEGRWPKRWIPGVRGVAGVALVELVLRNTFSRSWTGMIGVGWLVGLVALLAVSWSGAELAARRRSGASTPLSLWATATALAVVAGLSGSLKIAQLAGAVAAALGAVVVLSWWRPTRSLSGSGVSVAILVLFGLGLNAHFYSSTTGLDALLLAAAPVMPLLTRLPGLRQLRGWRATLAALALTLLPLAIAILRAALAFEPDPYASYYE